MFAFFPLQVFCEDLLGGGRIKKLMEDILYAGKPDHWHLRHFADYCNNAAKDDPLLPKAQATLKFLANRIALKRKAECDAARQYAKLKVASETTSL